ncbi:hypothetical protein [Chryseobacterium timonianum]|uniref:hypothetical protein n=1 Tax=Chryseobacterium timonianum TaxID=1805473 RepID=UPI00142D8D2C|nr:hypothetical protein [Chryseobacterium timonianum]
MTDQSKHLMANLRFRCSRNCRSPGFEIYYSRWGFYWWSDLLKKDRLVSYPGFPHGMPATKA